MRSVNMEINGVALVVEFECSILDPGDITDIAIFAEDSTITLNDILSLEVREKIESELQARISEAA